MIGCVLVGGRVRMPAPLTGGCTTSTSHTELAENLLHGIGNIHSSAAAPSGGGAVDITDPMEKVFGKLGV